MRIKRALWMAPLTLSLVVVWAGVCFAQSGLATAPEGGRAEAARGALNELVAAAVLPKSPDQADVEMDVRTDEAVAYSAESAASEPAEPAVPAPSATKAAGTAFSRIGIGVKVSTLGAGIEVGTPLAEKFNLRGGFNMFRYDRTLTNNGIQYAGQLQLQSAEAHLDWFPFWGFHVSPGIMFYNGNQFTATAAVPAGHTFSLGGTTYTSDLTTPVTGTGKLDFVKVAPSIMLGVGNLIPRSGRHYSFLFEVGAIYEGAARVALNLGGNICDSAGANCQPVSTFPGAAANIAAQQAKLQNDVNPVKFYPVISLGVGFNF